MKLRYFTTSLLLWGAMHTLFAQKNITTQSLLWFRYNNNLTFSGNWSLNTEVETRNFLNGTLLRPHQFIFRTVLRRQLSEHWSVGLGFTHFEQFPHDPESESMLAVPEFRPQLDFSLRQKTGPLVVSNRYLLEQRIFRNNDGIQLTEGYNYNFRLRFRLLLEWPFWSKADKSARLGVGDELMFNFGKHIVKNPFDQNRLILTLQYHFSKAVGLELCYFHWFQQRGNGTDYYQRHIFRLSVLHRIDLSRKG